MNPRHLDQTGGERESDSADLFKKKDSTGASKQVRLELVAWLLAGHARLTPARSSYSP